MLKCTWNGGNLVKAWRNDAQRVKHPKSAQIQTIEEARQILAKDIITQADLCWLTELAVEQGIIEKSLTQPQLSSIENTWQTMLPDVACRLIAVGVPLPELLYVVDDES